MLGELFAGFDSAVYPQERTDVGNSIATISVTRVMMVHGASLRVLLRETPYP